MKKGIPYFLVNLRGMMLFSSTICRTPTKKTDQVLKHMTLSILWKSCILKPKMYPRVFYQKARGNLESQIHHINIKLLPDNTRRMITKTEQNQNKRIQPYSQKCRGGSTSSNMRWAWKNLSPKDYSEIDSLGNLTHFHF